jgi:hypothetical protein
MRVFLTIIGLADIAIGILLIAVSGFILQGVYNTGPMMSDAIFYVAFVIWCFAAPLLAFVFRRRLSPTASTLIAASPAAIFLLLMIVPV